jgi:protein phosphatase
MTVRLRWGAVSDTGRVREANEDSILTADRLFVVADGMGGHAAGEVASQVAVSTLRDAFDEANPPTAEGIVAAVRQANRDIVRQSIDEPALRGMGTTVTGVALTGPDEARQLVVFNVGDSRTYRLRGGQLTRVTMDHSYVQELVNRGEITLDQARVHPNRNIVTRALGIDEEIEVDTSEVAPVPGDRYLACSDGLVDELDDTEILEVLSTVAEPQAAADELTRRAIAAGGRDNVSVIVIDVEGDDAASPAPTTGAEPVGGWLGDQEPLDTSDVPPPTSPPDPAEQTSTAAAGLTTAIPVTSGQATAASGTTTVARQDKHRRRLRAGTVVIVLAVVAVLGAAFGAINWYGRGSYFLAFNGEQVAVFQGRPGGVLWIDPKMAGTYPLEREQMTDAGQSRIEAEPTFSSRAAADAYVANLEDDPAAVIPPTTTTSSTTTTSTTTTTTTTTTTAPPPTTAAAPPAP